MAGIQQRYKAIIRRMAALEAQKGVHLTDEQREKIARFMIDEVGKSYLTPKELAEKIEEKSELAGDGDNQEVKPNAEVEKKYGPFYIKDKAKRAKRKQDSMKMKKLLLDDALEDQRKTEKYFDGEDTDRKVLVYFKPTDNCEEAEKAANEKYNNDLKIYFAPGDEEALKRYKKTNVNNDLSDEEIQNKIKENRAKLLLQTYRDNEEQMMKFGETLHINTDPDIFIKNFKTLNFLTTLTAEAENILTHPDKYNLAEGDRLLLEKYKSYSNVFAVAQKTMECIAGPEYEYINVNTVAHCKENLFDNFTFREDEVVSDRIHQMHSEAVTNLCDHPASTFLMNGRNNIVLHSDNVGQRDITLTEFVSELGQKVSEEEYAEHDSITDFKFNLEIIINNKNTDCNFRYVKDLVKFGLKENAGEEDHKTEWNGPVVHEANGRTVVFYAVNNSYTYKAPEMLYNDTLYSMGKELLAKLDKAESVLADINDSFWGKNEFKEIKRDLNKVYKLGWLKQGADAAEYTKALYDLSASCDKYINRKNGENVNNPSQRRQNRMDFVRQVASFADTKLKELTTVLKARNTLAELRKETEDVFLTAILNNLKADKRVYGEPINFNIEKVEEVLGAAVIKDCIRQSAGVEEVFKIKNDDEIIYRSKNVNLIKKLSQNLFIDRGFTEAYKTALNNKAAQKEGNRPEAGNGGKPRIEENRFNAKREPGFKLKIK